MGRPLNPHRTDVTVHGRDHLVGQRPNRDATLERTLDDLVIDVSDIAHIGDAVAALLEPALRHIEGHHHSRMADMAEIVNGHAADIHAHLTRHDRGKLLDRTGQGVVDTKGHGATRPASEQCRSREFTGRLRSVPAASPLGGFRRIGLGAVE